MLSNEERELIEEIQKGNKIGIYELIRTFKREGIENFITVRRKYIDIIINLIEKQSKEIEHQKEKRESQKKELAILNAKQIEFNKLVNTVNSYKGQFKRQEKEIEELKEKNKTLKNLQNDTNRLYIEMIERKNYFERELEKLQDKIKAKIEEWDKDIKWNNADDHYYAIKMMQSLLEKE